ncbi:hypothetical protein [Pseudomonas sp. COW5]|uniref:hypothetical protein n=1 Tax=Pseudomonas sp. COW5 TaxID=2981253 RepID=UPI0022479EA4|nr:hypothetical protein [Pseudomonas sp. COW5]MCX2546947.1 hypothetical protein [Pseudomonas sp. COW5]
MEMTWISNLLTAPTNILWTSLISAATSVIVAFIFRVREHKLKLKADYEHEQRKALRDIIGKSHGRFLHACNNLNYRFFNLYTNHDKGWLETKNLRDQKNYYINSFVTRFMSVFILVREFEKKSLYIDSRIANKTDLIFVKYVAALQWCMTDVKLFHSISYDASEPIDHFFSDSLRTYCEECTGDNDTHLSAESMLSTGEKFEPIFLFFVGLSPNEKRLRWDRLVCLHLLIVTFVNTIGYPEHITSKEKIKKIANKIQNKKILTNLATWLPRHGLNKDPHSKQLIKICSALGE